MDTVVYDNDTRYPGPEICPLPPFITGTPTQAELDAHPRLFTWGELKEIIQTGELEYLSRNKELQVRYINWMTGMKVTYGSTEKYLTQARLPWAKQTEPEPTYDQRTALDHPEIDLTPSTNPTVPKPKRAIPSELLVTPSVGTQTPGAAGCSHVATAATTPAGSGASTPSSVGFVSLSSILPRVNRALRGVSKRKSDITKDLESGEETEDDDEAEEEEEDVYLKYDPVNGLDAEKYAVLPNDWPYCVPYGVRHYCVWSRVPIAHPVLIDYDPTAWAKIESEGLGGFTGVTPVERASTPPGSLPTPPPSASQDSRGSSTIATERSGWYSIDVGYAGRELKRWAGVEYESVGGSEVGRMVRGLWDERGWECIWFVNPPRLQSVPGFSHFHVFARRKTPVEIDVSEAVYKLREEAKAEASP